MNYFAYPTVARRYADGRPFFHPFAVDKIGAICCEHGRIDRALDVGCGTGQSTFALLEVADEIVGLDTSAEMLSYAARHSQIRYLEGPAEQLSFSDCSFGLLTVAGAFHWFDQKRFLFEAQRVLRPGGWLVIYNDFFTGRMDGHDAYEKWNREQYLVRFPTPPRKDRHLADLEALEYGLKAVRIDEFVHEVEFTTDELVRYLLTQTNVIAAVEAGNGNLQSAAEWLSNSVRPHFAGTKEIFLFKCQMQFFRRE
jgi:ubiquinone/menaquinone biosynthesis C-methylase UbiE